MPLLNLCSSHPSPYTMPRGRFKADRNSWFNSLPVATPVPSLNPPLAPAVPTPSATGPPLQDVSPNKSRFHTAEDAAAAKRVPAKRQCPGPRPSENFGETRKLCTPPPLKRPRLHSYTRETKLKVVDYIADRRTWVPDLRPHVVVREGLQMEGSYRPLQDAEVAELFNISKANISRWWKARFDILQSRKGSRRVVG
jgi:hypothetical protein